MMISLTMTGKAMRRIPRNKEKQEEHCRKAGCGIGKSRAGEQRNKPQEGI